MARSVFAFEDVYLPDGERGVHSGIPVSLWDNTNEEEEKLIFLWGECISHRKNLLCEVLN